MPKTASILVVDDDTDIAASVSDILKDCGYRVDTVHNGTDAIECVRNQLYDMVILDYKMPDMNGDEVYRRIRELQSVTVAVMVTAFAGDSGMQRAKDAGTWHVLRKPVDVGELLRLVELALEQKTVLLIDDDHAFCLSMWDTLRERGYRVGLVHDATHAERELGSREYDFVLLDLRLGDADGEKVLQQVVASEQHPKVFVVTGLDLTNETVSRLSSQGVGKIYSKPISVENLISSLD